MSEVTTDTVLAAIREAMTPPVDDPEFAATVGEIAEATGQHLLKVRSAMKTLIRQGKVQSVRVRRRAIDGRVTPVPGYRVR